MAGPATPSEAFPPAREPLRPSDGATGSPAGQCLPHDGSTPDQDCDYPTPPPNRVFFVQVRYRHLGPGQPMPLAPEDLDDEP
jgi:hypothetical protein